MQTYFVRTLTTLATVLAVLSQALAQRTEYVTVAAPPDKPVSLQVGTVTISTFSPVTLSAIENGTHLNFVVVNESDSPTTLQFTSYNEINQTKPSWIYHLFKLFGEVEGVGGSTSIALGGRESRTLQFFLNASTNGSALRGTLPFRWRIGSSGTESTLPVEIIADDNLDAFKRTTDSTIRGRVLGLDQQPIAGARVTSFLFNEKLVRSQLTDAEGRFSFDVLGVDSLQTVLGSRPLPYQRLAYALTAEATGTSFSYTGDVAPLAGKSIDVDVTLTPLAAAPQYRLAGELATDGTLAYWWVRFAGSGDRIVAVQGQHPPVQPGPGHILAVDLTGKELWRVATGDQCWGFDVSPDGSRIAAGSYDGYVYIVSAEGQLLHKIMRGDRPSPSGPGAVMEVRFSPDGKRLLVDGAGGAGGYTVLDPQTGQTLWTSTRATEDGFSQAAYKARWSQDGRRVIAGSNGPLSAFTSAGALQWRTNMGESPLWLEIDPDNNTYAAGKSGILFSYDPAGKLRWSYRLANTTNEATSGVSADYRFLLLPTFNGLLQAFDSGGGVLWQRMLPTLRTADPSGGTMEFISGPGHNATAVTPDGRYVAIGTRAWQTLLYSRSGALLWSHTASQRADFQGENPDVHGHYTGIQSVCVSADAKYIVTGAADSVIRIFERTTTAAAGAPVIEAEPGDSGVREGMTASFNVMSATATAFQWFKDGQELVGATTPVCSIPGGTATDAGLYQVRVTNAQGTTWSRVAMLAVQVDEKVTGQAYELASDIAHPKGNIYDQVLLTGSTGSIQADVRQVTRVSFIDLDDDIVQVEMSGAGTLALRLESPTGPTLPALYVQDVSYMKGNARITISGADETTNLTIFSVGKMNAVNQALFKSGVTYDGFADIASISIQSSNGRFGGLRAANTGFRAVAGLTGIHAPGVQFTGPVFLNDITAADAATPVLLLGRADDVRITGGTLSQPNGQAVQVSGLTALQFADGTDSHGRLFPAQRNAAKLEQDGVDVTTQIVRGP